MARRGYGTVMPIVEAVLEAEPISRDELAESVWLAAGGTYSTHLSRARTAGLLRKRGGVFTPGDAFDGLP